MLSPVKNDLSLDRFEYQPFYIKVYRWLCYMPLAYILAYFYHADTNELYGNRGDWSLDNYISHFKAKAKKKMKHYWTLKEANAYYGKF